MSFSLRFREQLVGDLWAVGEELDGLVAQLNSLLKFNPDGSINFGQPGLTGAGAQNLNVDRLNIASGGKITGDVQIDATTRWLRGPWLFDPDGNDVNIAVIRPPDPGADINNWEPPGLATAIGIEVEPTANVNITGLKRAARHKRLLWITNRDNVNTLTLKNQSGSSSAENRFDLPNEEDVVLGTEQSVFLYYSTQSERWHLFITPHESGGLAGSPIKIATLSLTEAQIEALGTTPQTIVTGSGSTIICPLWMLWEINTTTAYTTTRALSIRYSGVATDLMALSTAETQMGAVRKSAHMEVLNDPNFAAYTTTNDIVGTSVVAIFPAGDPSTDGVATAKVTLAYLTRTSAF